MASLTAEHMFMLEKVLDSHFIPHLPKLIDESKPAADQRRKNLSRAFGAFALSNLCEVGPKTAAESVIDDFDDYGVDAIFYFAPTGTLYIVQSKLKAGEQFSQEDALAFCQGIRKLIRLDLDAFNRNAQNRRVDIEDALERCESIQLVVAHTGSGISRHAVDAINELLSDTTHGEERFTNLPVDYDSRLVVQDLQEAKAPQTVNGVLRVNNCTTVDEPRKSYSGLVQLSELVGLHQSHGALLYSKNIRTYLGRKTGINDAIRLTLETSPADFYYLNNGVTVLSERIKSSPTRDGKKRLELTGFSVINGAQTIASAADLLVIKPLVDISAASVSITVIEADPTDDFGKQVTRARNHQNPVLTSNFAALDDEQERLRRELSYLGIHYTYKAGETSIQGPQSIRIEEAVQALALTHRDPRYAIWLKKEPARLMDSSSQQYKDLFNPNLTAFQLANAVRIFRYIQARVVENANAATGMERLINKHGAFATGWILPKRVKSLINGVALVNDTDLGKTLSRPIDELRAKLIDKTQPLTTVKGPLALFRNQTDAVPLLQSVMIDYYGLSTDAVVGYKQREQKPEDPYPIALFEYLILKAPQIEIVK